MDYKNKYLFIIGILGIIFWSIDYWKVLKRPELFIPSGLKGKSKQPITLRILLYVSGVIAWLSISYSLMGPREAIKYDKSNIEVNDIFLVVDVSRSMLAEDFRPNRLEAAKKRVLEFIKLKPNDRIGIIIFSERAFTLLPLTTDLSLIDKVIEDIQTGFLGAGTNIGDALGLAVARATISNTKNKVIILLTDGVSNVGNLTPLQAAEMAKEQGIKVYTIGIGSDKDAKIPAGNGIFGKVYQYIPGGSIDTKTLNEISKITGGRSYVARNENALKEVLSDIEKLEKTEIDVQGRIVYKEKFYMYLLSGVVLLILVEILRKWVLKEVI